MASAIASWPSAPVITALKVCCSPLTSAVTRNRPALSTLPVMVRPAASTRRLLPPTVSATRDVGAVSHASRQSVFDTPPNARGAEKTRVYSPPIPGGGDPGAGVGVGEATGFGVCDADGVGDGFGGGTAGGATVSVAPLVPTGRE